MASLLSKLYSGFNVGSVGNTNVKFSPFTAGSNFTGFSFSPKVQALPNTTDTIQGVTTTKTPVVPAAATSGVAQTTPATNFPKQYVNPTTGGFYTPEQIAANITKSIPGGSTYDIPKFAGDTLTQGPQTTEQLTNTAAGLTNARNDIATGQTDSYAAASQSGVAYSPEEMAAIEKAYAGVYDPAINTALDKLTQRQKREDITFQTNESIREAAAKKTAAAGGALGLVRGADGYVDPNEYMKKAYAYEAAGKNIKEFLLDYPPAQYINPAAIGTLPAYLQPKLADKTNAELVAEVRKELTRPEIKALTDEEKAYIIAHDYGLDPVTFGIYGSGYGSY